MRRAAIGGIGIALTLLSAACDRERRDVRPMPAQTGVFADTARESTLLPGGAQPPARMSNATEGNAYAIAEGQRLFNWYNCSGCHANGGGGIGPPLIKTEWIYGGEPDNIFDTIVKGRPNGMPAWGGKIPEYQIWQIVAFVRSLSGLEPQSATPVRSDTLEQHSDSLLPKPVGTLGAPGVSRGALK